MMLMLALAVAPTVALGAQVVAAEARGESFAERARVACVIANRADDAERWRGDAADPWRSVMLASGQFAAPYAGATVVDAAAFVAGATLRPCDGAVMFATPEAVERHGLVDRWGSGGFVPVLHGAHTYFAEVAR